MHRILIILLIIAGFLATPSLAQHENLHENSSKLLPKDTLSTFFPDRFGSYTLGQISEPPFQSDPPEAIFLNALYNSEKADNYYFIQLNHYRSPEVMREMADQNWQSSMVNKTVSDKEYKGFSMREDRKASKVSVYVADVLEVGVYGGKNSNLEDIYVALGEIDLPGLHNLIGAGVSNEVPTSEPEVMVEFKKFNCDSLNRDLRAEMKNELDADLVPWSHFLRAKEASTAKINGDEMIFPKKGNDWLQCVRQNDILWSPLEMPMFLKRVKSIAIKPGEVILITENAGFPDVMYRGKVKMDMREENPEE